MPKTKIKVRIKGCRCNKKTKKERTVKNAQSQYAFYPLQKSTHDNLKR